MNYGRVWHRRLLKLEWSQRPSVAGRMKRIQQAALAAMSLAEVGLLKDSELLTRAGREEDATDEQQLAQTRFEEAYENALVEAGPCFTIAEMDQILGAE